jgi:hypothetical protein
MPNGITYSFPVELGYGLKGRRDYVMLTFLVGCALRRAGTFRQGRIVGLAPSRDLDFPALPLLVGLRLGKRNGDPASARVRLEVFAADGRRGVDPRRFRLGGKL